MNREAMKKEIKKKVNQQLSQVREETPYLARRVETLNQQTNKKL